jgi:sulfur-oxidizing protein SoxY
MSLHRPPPRSSFTRRQALAATAIPAALAAIGLASPARVKAADGAFAATTLADALQRLGARPATSDQIALTAPDIAENGAVVQVGVTSKLPRTEEIHFLVEKNANPLVASYVLAEGTEPFLQMRVKMGQSTPVWALVKADGRWYAASRETKVTLGGCGG